MFLESTSWASASVLAVVFTFLGILVRQASPWKKVTSEADARLRDSLIRRVEKLERMQARHDAEKRALLHKLRNMTANFDAMLMMLEMNPDRGPEIVALIKEARAKQMVAEAQEFAIINAAEIAADKKAEDQDGSEL